MAQKGLVNFFEGYLKKEPLFLCKGALQSQYMPESISHRDNQIKQIANILAPSLRLDKPSNLFLYGKTGTGKTLAMKYTMGQMEEVAKQNNIPLTFVYVNCKLKKVADTEYRIIAQLIKEFGKTVPATGLPTDEVYKIFFSTIDREKRQIVVVLDEVDQLVKKTGDEILYNLTRVNEELKNAKVSIVGISNDLIFVDTLDPRVRSSLSEEELVFPPYNALQIQDILKQRATVAFKADALAEGLIEKCAAYAAREHGDARRALELLRVSAELAERENQQKVCLKHLDEAEEKIEKERIIDIVLTQPKQYQAILYSIIIATNKRDSIFTGEVYDLYRQVCIKTGLRPLTQRRVSDVITEFDMFGLINIKTISKGRYGRTRQISLSITPPTTAKIKKMLEEGTGLS